MPQNHRPMRVELRKRGHGMTGRYVWQLHEVDEARIAAVGGKGAHLGALTRIDGVRVPRGFCVTTDAFRLVARTPALAGPLDRLARADAD
ncbi:phosphoenolpyruvate synthase, partial [Micromonospora chalcea]